MKIGKIACLLLVLTFSVQAYSQTSPKRFEKDSLAMKSAFTEIEKGNVEAGFQLALPQAKAGNAVAQFMVGCGYAEGMGVSENDLEAFKWMKLSAEKGYSQAETRLALMYSNSEGVKQDYSQVIQWFTKAANQQDEVAIYHLTTIYGNGLGVTQNHSEALKWMTLGSKLGYASSEKNLAIAYKNGFGVAKSDSLAMNWFLKAAQHGDAESQYIVGRAHVDGFVVEKNEVLAIEYFKKSVNQGYDASLKSLLALYYKEIGMPKGKGGLTNLGLLFLRGNEGIEKNSEIAFKLFETHAIQNKNGEAYYYLGYCHENGEGTVKDVAKARVMYQMAVTYGYEAAQKEVNRLATKSAVTGSE